MIKHALPRILFLLKLIVFWILVFHVMRILFIIHNAGKVSDAGWGEVAKAFIYSFRLDLTTAAILSIIPFILYTIWKASASNILKIVFKIVLAFLVTVVVLLSAGEVNVYPEWNHKLSGRVFTHLANPDEVGRTASWKMVFWFSLYGILGLISSLYLYKKLFKQDVREELDRNWSAAIPTILVFILFTPVLFILARGGLQPIPINIDAAYYSSGKNASVANDISVNTTYNFAKSYLLHNRNNLDDIFPIMDYDKALSIKKILYSTESDTLIKILSNKRPNIVFVVLEGWSANAMKSLTHVDGVTPHFDELTKQGVLFSKFYANGGTSEIGNGTIFGGFPALPEISMSMQPGKHRKLPSMNEDLKKLGYYSGYVFSGDLKYGNIGSFFTDHGFDKVEDENDFPRDLERGRLNYYDEDLYKFFLKNINSTKEPFLQAAFTGSTHSPYDYPKRTNQTYKGREQEYMNSMIYADEELHKFLQKCKNEKWYKNTLFVLVSDHGHTTPEQNDPNQGSYFHIPLLMFGEVIKPEMRGQKIDIIGGQNDIVATLFGQMGIDASNYPWSKNLLNPSAKSFALHTVNRGYGWISKEGNFSYNLDVKRHLDQNYSPEDLKKQSVFCRAYLVELYRQFKAL